MGRAHLGPVLHLVKTATAAFAGFVALAGRANGDARGVRRGCVPLQPSRVGRTRHGVFIRFLLAVVHHQGINFSQRARGCGQGHAIGRRTVRAPIVDGRLDVGDMNACHGGCLEKRRDHSAPLQWGSAAAISPTNARGAKEFLRLWGWNSFQTLGGRRF